jgi:alpha-L-rhamnosidase
MQCSVYCAASVIEWLYNGARSDLAHDLLTSAGRRSWMNMIADGAGATAEAWAASLKGNMTYSRPWAASPAYHMSQGMFSASSRPRRATAPSASGPSHSR